MLAIDTMLVLYVGTLHMFLASVLADIPPCYGEFTGSALVIFKLTVRFVIFFPLQHKSISM